MADKSTLSDIIKNLDLSDLKKSLTNLQNHEHQTPTPKTSIRSLKPAWADPGYTHISNLKYWKE